jgi:hypothetical protein
MIKKIKEEIQNESILDLTVNLISQDYTDIKTTAMLIKEYGIPVVEFTYFTKEKASEYGIPVGEIALIVSLYEYAIQELYELTGNMELLDIVINYYGLDSIELTDITDDVMELLNSRIDCRFSQLIKKALS